MRQIFFTLLFCYASLLYGTTEIMPLQEIKPGMRGIGLTVFENNQIEQFEIEVIDIVQNFLPQRDLIVVRLLGDRVNHTGVVAGMSGSPIYIDGKLIGALAYSMGVFMKDPIAGVTPIQEMLEIFTRENVRDQEIISSAPKTPPFLEENLFSARLEKFDLFSLLNLPQTAAFQEMKPIETPLVVTGLSPLISENIDSRLQQINLKLLPGGRLAPSQLDGDQSLQPGSAVAGTMISGDFDISTVGTVTYRDGNKILAFGHPFFNSGPVNIPMSVAKVITTLSSYYASNKFAVATNVIGNIRQDRSTGIMGVIGDIPSTIPVTVKIGSPVVKEKQFHFKVINDRSSFNMVPVFLWMTLINALESARLGSGDYALKLNGRIDLENSADVLLTDFYSGGGKGFFNGSGLDISEAAYDIVMALSALLLNKFETPKINKLDLEFYAQPGRYLAEIEKVFYDKQDVTTGDSLNLIIFLRPYQGKIVELKKRIDIPEELVGDILTVSIGGRDEITNWELQAGIGRFSPANMGELVSLLNHRRKSTQIIIQLKAPDQGVVLHGREYPTLPPSIHQILTNKKTQKIYESVTEKVIREWIIPIELDIRGGRKFNLRVKHD